MPCLDQMTLLVSLSRTGIQRERACVQQVHGLQRADRNAAAAAMPKLEHERKNSENRGCADEERMMRRVLKQLTHVRGGIQACQRIVLAC